MPTEFSPEMKFEIGHVLFIDIVGYSKLHLNQQRTCVEALNRLVRQTREFRNAEAEGKLVRLPTGDGMALVFYGAPEAPAECAVEIGCTIKQETDLQVRMGIHSGPVSNIVDVNERRNIAGAGINMAQRVMDCGDAGHILLSKRTAEDLEHSGKWQAYLHPIGDCEVKHGVTLSVVNLYADNVGNRALPSKLKQAREQQAAINRAKVIRRRKRIGSIAAALLLTSTGIGLWFVMRSTSSNLLAKSVAVLPFENLSEDKTNAFFATGIQDEIITRLAKVSALKVISRTSTQQYESRPSNLSQIAKELGVGAILEGSVQKVGERIRVNVQLIQASSDSHLWADTYDRELLDILDAESEIAREVAAALSATLSPEEKTRIQRRPTNNTEAYGLYLKAREVETHATGTVEVPQEAQSLYEQAIRLDPDFALAHASLSFVHSWIYAYFEPTEPHRIGARVEAEQSLRLQPDLGEGYLARANYYYRVERDFNAALESLNRARQILPNDSMVLWTLGHIRKRQGLRKEAIADLKQAISVDPRNVRALDQLGNIYMDIKQWAAAEQAKRRVTEIIKSPADSVFNARLAWAEADRMLTGNWQAAHKILADVPEDFDPGGIATLHRYAIAMSERDFMTAERAVRACKLDKLDEWNGPEVTKSFLLGTVALAQGDMSRARPLFEVELQLAESQVKDNPTSPKRRGQLGLVLAYLGRKEEAIREGGKAVELLPESVDASEGVDMSINLAEIYGRVGEPDQALSLIERLLKTPGGLTILDLQGWNWDPLRKDARFQKLANGPEPQVIYK
jgi:TolB-like protein